MIQLQKEKQYARSGCCSINTDELANIKYISIHDSQCIVNTRKIDLAELLAPYQSDTTAISNLWVEFISI